MRSMRGEGVSLIPLINVVFLLLLFFLVSGHFSQEPPMKSVTLPSSAHLRSIFAPPPAALSLVIERSSKMRLDGVLVDAAGLERRLADAPPQVPLVIYADENVDALFLLEMLARLDGKKRPMRIMTRVGQE